MDHLMQLTEEEVLEIPLLKFADYEPIASPNLVEEDALPKEPQKAPVTTTHPLMHKEQAPKPEGSTGLGKATMESPDSQRCLLPLLGFGPLPRELEPPPLEEAKILIGIPNPEGEVQPNLMPIGAVNCIVFRNECTGA